MNNVSPVGYIPLIIQIGDKTISHNFYVLEKLPFPCIIGIDLLRRLNITLSMSETQDKFWFQTNPENVLFLKNNLDKLAFSVIPSTMTVSNNDVQFKIKQLLQQFPTVVRTDKKLGRTTWAYHIIEASDERPVKQRPYPCPNPTTRNLLRKELDNLLTLGVIRPSRSPWASPCFFVEKKTGDWRLVIDYVEVNKQTISNAAPMHNTNMILRFLPTGGWFSIIDLKSGYWQIALHPDSIQKSAVTTQWGLFEFLVMPFGLKNAPATFVTLMDRVLDGYIYNFVALYMDDILIYSKTFDEHLEHIRLVLSRLEEAGLCVNLLKCTFAVREITFLGHCITQEGISKSADKVKAIVEYPRPKKIKDLQRFVGLCMWYSTFVENFATIAAPLYALFKKRVKYKWGDLEENAFVQLKKVLSESVIIHGIDYTLPFIVRTDASDVGLGAILIQIYDGKERVIYFASRSLNEHERNLHTCEKECLAIHWALTKFRDFIWGEHVQVETDHKALYYWKSMLGKSKKLDRWRVELSDWDITIVHRPGKQNIVADALSRAPLPEDKSDTNFMESTRDIVFAPTLSIFQNLITLKELVQAQRLESTLNIIIQHIVDKYRLTLTNSSNWMATKTDKIYLGDDGYVLKNEVLCKYVLKVGKSSQKENPGAARTLPGTENSQKQLLKSEVDDESQLSQIHGSHGNPSNQINLNELLNSKASHSKHDDVMIDNSNQLCSPISASHGVPKRDVTFNLGQFFSATAVRMDEYILVPVIPKSLVSQILTYFYDDSHSGHQGVHKTKQKIKSRVFWNNMNKDIHEYVKSCQVC